MAGGQDVRGERSAGAAPERRGGPLGSRPAEGPLRAGRAAGDAGLALRRGGRLLPGGQGRNATDWPGGFYTYEDPDTSAVAGPSTSRSTPKGRRGAYIYSGSHTFAIPATVRDRPAAIQLLRFLTSRESQAFEAGLGTLPGAQRLFGRRPVRGLPVRWRNGGGICWRRRRRRRSSRPSTRTTPRWRTPSGRVSARRFWVKECEQALGTQKRRRGARRRARMTRRQREDMVERGVTDPSSRRTLGGTGFSVSPVCVGCAPLGDMPETFEYSV